MIGEYFWGKGAGKAKGGWVGGGGDFFRQGAGGGLFARAAQKASPPSPPTPPASPVEPERRRGGIVWNFETPQITESAGLGGEPERGRGGVVRGVGMSSDQKVWGLKVEIKKARKNGPFYSKNFYLTPNQGSGRVGFGEGNLKGAL